MVYSIMLPLTTLVPSSLVMISLVEAIACIVLCA